MAVFEHYPQLRGALVDEALSLLLGGSVSSGKAPPRRYLASGEGGAVPIQMGVALVLQCIEVRWVGSGSVMKCRVPWGGLRELQYAFGMHVCEGMMKRVRLSSNFYRNRHAHTIGDEV